jgi:hypothetical protein
MGVFRSRVLQSLGRPKRSPVPTSEFPAFGEKFPVPLRREFAHQVIEFALKTMALGRTEAQNT